MEKPHFVSVTDVTNRCDVWRGTPPAPTLTLFLSTPNRLVPKRCDDFDSTATLSASCRITISYAWA